MPPEQRGLTSRYVTGSGKGSVIAVRLATPQKIRDLQKALYLKAKQSPKLRFYALYDKVYRRDVLHHAFALCRANHGAAGPDGKTFEDIEREGVEALLVRLTEQLKEKTYRPGPVRRVYIPKANGGERPLGIPNIADRVVQMAVKLVVEPIFEADFESDSYGFRPQRNAHQALTEVRQCIADGMTWVIDADVTAYFDTIPHDKLMKVVASRIVDGSVLALIKLFLVAPVIDARDGGGPRCPTAGTPQGGVISPLLANLYLHLLDRSFRRRVDQGEFDGRLIRYCDDFVLMTRRQPEQELSWLNALMSRLGLSLHPDKTRVVDARNERFDFLGYRVGWRSKQLMLDVSPKSYKRIHARLRQTTRLLFLPIEEIVDKLNPYIRGARSYFRLAPWWSLRTIDGYMAQRMARWWRRKLGLKYPAWSRVSEGQLHTKHGLVSWADVPPWDPRAACASK